MTVLAVVLLLALVVQQVLHQKERERLLKLRFANRNVVPVVAVEDDEPPAWVAPDDDKGHFEAVKERS